MINKRSLFFVFIGLNQLIYAQSLQSNIKKIETQLSGRIGVAIMDTQNRKIKGYRADEHFPLMSTSKTLICAKLLFDFQQGKLTENALGKIEKQKMIEWSPVTKKYIGHSIKLKDACQYAMLTSDNAATNLVLENIGGPLAITGFSRFIGDSITRLDRYEPDLNKYKSGDMRDTTTPNAMVKALDSLLFGRILTKPYKNRLRQWMINNKVSGSLLRSVLPAGWSIADRSGAGKDSRGITAIVWSEKLPPVIITIYLTQAHFSLEKRNKIIAQIGKKVFRMLQQR